MSKKTRLAVFQPEFIEDLGYWVETDRKLALRAFDLIDAILCDPFNGIGKPEPLKYLVAGVWSRRLTREHRIVYLVREDRIDFFASQVSLLADILSVIYSPIPGAVRGVLRRKRTSVAPKARNPVFCCC